MKKKQGDTNTYTFILLVKNHACLYYSDLHNTVNSWRGGGGGEL
jgi:hypothetical protein